MAKKEYKLEVSRREPKARSKRLRELGGGSGGNGSTVVEASSSAGGGGSQHSHANLATLDKLSADDDGYVYLDQLREGADDEGNPAWATEREKIKAGYADKAQNLAEDSSDWDTIDQKDAATLQAAKEYTDETALSKVHDDTAKGKIAFDKGLDSRGDANFGNFVREVSGASVYRDDAGNWHIEGDYLHARRKLTAKEIQIEEVKHVGGQMLLTAAECVVDHVVEHDDFYRCYFLKEESDGKRVANMWKKGDQALMQSFNVEQWEGGGLRGNRRYWRLVVGTSADADVLQFHYIDLSKADCESGSDTPLAGDSVVQLGYRWGDDADRQNAIVIAGAGSGTPYIDEYAGVDGYTLEKKMVTRLRPNDNMLTGKVVLQPGSTFSDGTDVNEYIGGLSRDLSDVKDSVSDIEDLIDGDTVNAAIKREIGVLVTGNENLLRNTGFTGDYLWEDVKSGSEVDADTEMYSRHLGHWDASMAAVVVSHESTSGFAVSLAAGRISQEATHPLASGSWYCASFKGSGTSFAVSLGGDSVAGTLDGEVKRYIVKLRCSDTTASMFSLRGTGTFSDLMLTQGDIPNSDWLPSPLDNAKTLAYYQNVVYLSNAISEGSTTILGGLILSQMLRVGNYRNGKMTSETGGMSGLYMSGNSPFLWGGGDMDQAFYTIGKYANNPAYRPTQEELSRMAKFVVTHGGRAILNDIVLRGYIYALGGYFRGEVHAESGVFRGEVHAESGVFRGEVHAESGVFKNVHSPNNSFAIDEEGNFSCSNARIGGNMYTPLYIIDASNYMHALIPQPDGNYLVNLAVTGLNIQMSYWNWAQSATVALPLDDLSLLGARITIFNQANNKVTVVHQTRVVGGWPSLQHGEVGEFLCYKTSSGNCHWVRTNIFYQSATTNE